MQKLILTFVKAKTIAGYLLLHDSNVLKIINVAINKSRTVVETQIHMRPKRRDNSYGSNNGYRSISCVNSGN